MPADHDPAAPDTIVLIHGFWVTPRSWEEWIAYYQDKGYRVLAPAYPGFEVEVEALNADPTPIENLTVPAVIDHLTEVIGGLERPPILMGHSAGGVFTQLMLDRGYGAVGVVMDSAPTEGVPVVPLSQLKSTFPALRTVGRKKAAGFTFAQWHYAFCNTFPEERSRQLYERYHIPASVRVLWGSALATLEPGHQDTFSTTTTTTGRRCCSSPAPTTTSCRPRCSAPTPSTTSPRRSPRWWSSTGRTCCRPATAGKRSPTTPSPGPWRTPSEHLAPEHDNAHHPQLRSLRLHALAGREAALDPAEEATGALGPGALAHDPQPELPAVAGDDLLEAVPVHARPFQCRPPSLPEGVGDPGSGVDDRRSVFRVLVDQGPGALAQPDRLLGEREVGRGAHRSRGTGARSVPV